MSFLSDLTGIDIDLGQMWDDVTGVTTANAATEAAQIQSNAATAAGQATADATALQRQDLQPFSEFGSSFMDPTQQAVTQSQQLFSDPSSIMQNPFFQALQNQAQTDIMQNAAVSGRLGTGGTQTHLQDSALRTGFDVLNQERAAQMQNVGMLQGLVGMGQNAAAGQAGFTGVGNQIQQGFLTDAAAANAGGVVGAANAQASGTGNLINLGTTIGSAMAGVPPTGLNFGTPTAAPVAATGGGTNRFSGNTTGYMS